MKFLFFVQGEGRGHMTQAIALAGILRSAGHTVSKVMVGKSNRREIPEFFHRNIGSPVEPFESPNFVTDGKNKGVRIIPTIFSNLKKLRTFNRTLNKLREILHREQPDVVINFYELLAGLLYFRYKPKVPMVCIGHQYLLTHPDFVFPSGHRLDKLLLSLNTRMTASNAVLKLALSFSDMVNVPEKNLYVVPPLLRREVLNLTPDQGEYIHGYLLNAGYAEEIVSWHKQNTSVHMHFFWDHKDSSDEWEVQPGLTFHRINDVKFLEYMKSCRGFATTAGFESICEAMYLAKPVLMVPTGGHFEQKCNALDAELAGAGISDEYFNISRLLAFIPQYNLNHARYRNWVQEAPQTFLQHMGKLRD